MRKKFLFFYVLMLLTLFFVMGSRQGSAIEIWEDKLDLSGFLRYELCLHTATKNPLYEENHKFNLVRAFFQTEWEFTPTDRFKLYSKVKLIHDQTDNMNGDSFDAFPRSAPSELRIAGNNEYQFEATELYSDINAGRLFLRLGRQQIVWGEMIGGRVMDLINPLDMSWHTQLEPEEFENIRVAQWAIRWLYSVEQDIVPWLWNFTLEGFVNPGDVSPTVWADKGAPFFLREYPSLFKIDEKDRRGDTEYGFRIGGSIGEFYMTLNYLRLYSDDGYLKYRTPEMISEPGYPSPQPTGNLLLDMKFPLTDVYGFTVNYAWNQPYNLALTFEATYIPNQPYIDGRATMPEIRDKGTWNYAIRFMRDTFVFPTPISAMKILFQFNQTVIEGDSNDILGPGVKSINSTREIITVKLTQPFLKGNRINTDFQIMYDLDDCYLIKPLISYIPGDRWSFDIQGAIFGGSERRTARFGSMHWMDEIMFRVTCQF
jgi:hypothetical protein